MAARANDFFPQRFFLRGRKAQGNAAVDLRVERIAPDPLDPRADGQDVGCPPGLQATGGLACVEFRAQRLREATVGRCDRETFRPPFLQTLEKRVLPDLRWFPMHAAMIAGRAARHVSQQDLRPALPQYALACSSTSAPPLSTSRSAAARISPS